MDANLSTALTALMMGMGTVFVGLTLLQWAMYFSAWAFNGRRGSPTVAPDGSSAKGEGSGTVVQPSAEPAPRVRWADGQAVSAQMAAAVALALHLDDHAMRELEAQRLTWSEMIKPFSPWLMDGKTSLHTRRIRWRPNAAPGRIVRHPGLGK